MAFDDRAIREVIRTRILRLNAILLGVTVGLISGSGIFLATIILVLKGGSVVGPHLGLLGQYFIGYSVTVTGSLIGFGYGFASGFVIGFAIGGLYNRMADLRQSRHSGKG